MTIPDVLVDLVRELAHRHLAEQIHQVRRMGVDHPQSRLATFHLEQARALVELVGSSRERAA